jgi:nicotinamidase-related amidase
MSKNVKLFIVAVLLAAASGAFGQDGPNKPEAKPVTLEAKTTAILVSDLNARCHDPKEICSKLMPALGEFLEKARAAAVPIIYTVSARAKGTPLGEVATPLKRRDNEPVIYPDAFDKFHGGELQELLKQRGAKKLVLVGSSTNMTVLYTATAAARMYEYDVVIPMDGMNARLDYEQEYTFHQFTVLSSNANKRFQFTKLAMIGFK